MEEYLEIFDDIYAIKDSIPDEYFLSLNNRVQKLIQEIMELKKEKTNKKMVIYHGVINRERIQEYQSDEEEYESEEEEEYDSEEEEEDVQDIVQNIESEEESELELESDEEELELEEEEEIHNEPHICRCSERWYFTNFPNINFISEYFCLQNDEDMKNCSNFKKLLEEIPLLNNIFEKQDIPFMESSIDQEYNGYNVRMYIRILLSLVEKFYCKKRKTIISFVMYDYIMKNIRILKDNQKFAKACLKKYEDFLRYEPEYISLANEYGVNYDLWLNELKNVIVESE